MDIYGLVIGILFLVALLYFKLVEEPYLPDWILTPLVILFFIFAFWDKFNDLKRLKKGYRNLKTEPFNGHDQSK